MEKLKFLGTAALIFKILGWIAGGIGVVSCLVILIGGGGPDAPRISGLIALFLGGIYWLFFFAGSALINTIVEIAQNTKSTGPAGV